MKWKTVAAIMELQNHLPKDLLNRSFAVSTSVASASAGMAFAYLFAPNPSCSIDMAQPSKS